MAAARSSGDFLSKSNILCEVASMDETGDRSEHQEEPEIKRPVPVAERPKLVMPDGQEIELEDE